MTRETYCSLRAKGWFIHPDGSWSKTPPRDLPQSPKPEPAAQPPPDAVSKREAFYTGRVLVRVKSHRVRLLDPDNLCPKYFIDCLRYAGFLPDDNPACVVLQNEQEKVATKKEERTEIEVIPMP